MPRAILRGWELKHHEHDPQHHRFDQCLHKASPTGPSRPYNAIFFSNVSGVFPKNESTLGMLPEPATPTPALRRLADVS